MSAGPADKVLDTFKSLVFDQLVRAAIASIVGLAPWLAYGPVSFLITRVVTYVCDRLYDELAEAVNFEMILLKNSAYHKEYLKAHIELRGIAKNVGIDSPEFKASREKHKAALAKFVRFGGT